MIDGSDRLRCVWCRGECFSRSKEVTRCCKKLEGMEQKVGSAVEHRLCCRETATAFCTALSRWAAIWRQLLLFYLKERHTARRFSTLIEYARLSLSRRLYQLLI